MRIKSPLLLALAFLLHSSLAFNIAIAQSQADKVSESSEQLVDFRVSDPKLQSCIDAHARKKHWQKTTDVINLACHNEDIASLAGLEGFTNLEKLSFHKNNIENVSLSGLVKLKHLNLSRNKLSVMELDNLPELEELYFFGNRLPQVRLHDLPGLKQIKGNASEIEHFEYQNLPSLEKIYLFDNKMETIDINRLPAMKYMDVRQNPMPDELYEDMDKMPGVTILHDGNAEDWQ